MEFTGRTGYELREDLRLGKAAGADSVAKQALEEREGELHPGQAIEDKKQISFADKDARIMRPTTRRSVWTAMPS